MKTIQTWFNDFDYDWSGENNHKLVYPHLLKLTRRLELATQLVIGQNKYCATEYQVCILCLIHLLVQIFLTILKYVNL